MGPAPCLPADRARATFVGRVWDPEAQGPSVVHLRGEALVDISRTFPTVADLLDAADPARAAADAPGGKPFPVAAVLLASERRDAAAAHLLAPCDLQAIKACGVTFARSMIERVIEERAGGDFAAAAGVRARIADAVGGMLSDLRPGSAAAAEVKRALQADGLWSQYLEVGIGPDAEVFTKAPVLSAVGWGAEIGLLRQSAWNNPEPEVVLAVDRRGTILGATLGNDVNLRDIEGRSALLLGKAKDNNASCAIGPLLRLFDDGFGLDDVRRLELTLTVSGRDDGYVLRGASSMCEISRDPADLVAQAMGANHQYPDGMMLFLGTLFAPTEDRDTPGQGFTHKPGDLVVIANDALGALANVVTHADAAPPWSFGLRALMRNLASRGLLHDA